MRQRAAETPEPEPEGDDPEQVRARVRRPHIVVGKQLSAFPLDFAKTEEQVSVAEQLDVADLHRVMRVAATKISKVESKEHEPTEALSI